MSEPEPKPTPSPAIRLAWWFGIYFAGSIPLIVRTLHDNSFVSDHPWVWPLIFPGGLFGIAGYGVYLFHLLLVLRADSRLGFDLLLILLVVLVSLNQFICSGMIGAVTM